MTISDAEKIINQFYYDGEQEEGVAAFEEACHFLIEKAGRPELGLDLGGYYYGKKHYDLALKYYTLAADRGLPAAWLCLGYIWYYGRLGTPDPEKAFQSFAKTIELLTGKSVDEQDFWRIDRRIVLKSAREYDEYINAAYKLADMYRSGRYVDKDYHKFAYLVRQLYKMMSDPNNQMVPDFHMPEIELRMADAELKLVKSPINEEGELSELDRDRIERVVGYLFDAKSRMAFRLFENQFFGNFSIMKSIVMKIYELIAFDPEEMDLYDLYFLLQKPCKVTFWHKETEHVITSELDEGTMAASLDGKWYRTIDDLLEKGRIDGVNMAVAFYNCDDFEVTSM